MLFFWKKNREQQNRRKVERVLFHHPVKLLVPSLACIRGEGYVDVKARNISEGGVLIETKRSYPRLVPCRIKLESSGKPPEIILDGMIMWAQEKQTHGIWEVGVAFVNMREEDRIFLHQILLQRQ